ncbi:MAG: hypothetical protein ACSLFK_09105 [Gemmatimonadaceae bacterium]
MPAIASHDSAQRAHSSAQRFISSPSSFPHDSSQARQTLAHTPHVSEWLADCRSMKFALV